MQQSLLYHEDPCSSTIRTSVLKEIDEEDCSEEIIHHLKPKGGPPTEATNASYSDDEGGIDFNEDELYPYQEEFENTENFTCHQDYKTHTSIVVGLKFWLEGVTLSITGAFGLFGNLITLKVLRKQVSLFRTFGSISIFCGTFFEEIPFHDIKDRNLSFVMPC